MTDLFDPSFPHGTATGYDQGCKGGACLYRLDPEWLSCKEAHQERRTNYKLARTYTPAARIPRDPILRDIAAGVAPSAPVPAAPTTRPEDTVVPVATNLDDAGTSVPVLTPDESPTGVVETPLGGGPGLTESGNPVSPGETVAEPTPTIGKNGRPLSHGTPGGYQRGCRQDAACPNNGTDQPTCRQRQKQYAHDRNAAKTAAKRGLTLSAEESTAPSPAVPSPAIVVPPDDETSSAETPVPFPPSVTTTGTPGVQVARHHATPDFSWIDGLAQTGGESAGITVTTTVTVPAGTPVIDLWRKLSVVSGHITNPVSIDVEA